MSAHVAAPVSHIAGAVGVVLVLATAVWRLMCRLAGRAAATSVVITAFTASALMWIAIVVVVRLLVRAVMR